MVLIAEPGKCLEASERMLGVRRLTHPFTEATKKTQPGDPRLIWFAWEPIERARMHRALNLKWGRTRGGNSGGRPAAEIRHHPLRPHPIAAMP